MKLSTILFPWQTTQRPSQARLITYEELKQREAAVKFFQDVITRLKDGKLHWTQTELDEAEKMQEVLGPDRTIKEVESEQTHRVSELLYQIRPKHPGVTAFEDAYHTLGTPEYNKILSRYQALFAFLQKNPSQQATQNTLYSIFQQDPVAIFVCISHPILQKDKFSQPYQFMKCILEKSSEWKKIVKIILDHYKVIGLTNVERLLLPIIEKALARDFSALMHAELEYCPGWRCNPDYWEEVSDIPYKNFMRDIALMRSEYSNAPQKESIHIIQLPQIVSKLLEKENTLKHYLFGECKKVGDFEKIRILIESNHLSPQQIDKLELLHYATRAGNFPLIKYLIKKGANINYIAKSYTPLYYAIAEIGDAKKMLSLTLKIVEYFIQNNADIESLDSTPTCSALHQAIEENKDSLVKLFLKYGTNPNRCDGSGNTPIYMAVSRACTDKIVESLIQANADVDRTVAFHRTSPFGFLFRNERPDTPMASAIAMGNNLNIILSLIRAGASDSFDKQSLLNPSVPYSRTIEEKMPQIQKFHRELYSTLQNKLSQLTPPISENSHDFLRFILKAAPQAYAYKRYLNYLQEHFKAHKVDTKFIWISHLMFLRYGLHPLKYSIWPKQLGINGINLPETFENFKAFCNHAELFVNNLVGQKKFEWPWLIITQCAKLPIELIEHCLLIAWRNHAISEIEKTLPSELQHYIQQDQYRSFIESLIAYKEMDALESWFKAGYPADPSVQSGHTIRSTAAPFNA